VTKKEDIGDLYRDTTDSTRSLVWVRHEAQKRDRVKPGCSRTNSALLTLGDAWQVVECGAIAF
jgi:hypothetical protein